MAVSEHNITAAVPDRARRAFTRTVGVASLLGESPVGVLGALLVLFWVIVAVLAPVLAPFRSISPGRKPAKIPKAKYGAINPRGFTPYGS